MSSESQPVKITLFNKPHTESVVCALQISIVPSTGMRISECYH